MNNVHFCKKILRFIFIIYDKLLKTANYLENEYFKYAETIPKKMFVFALEYLEKNALYTSRKGKVNYKYI